VVVLHHDPVVGGLGALYGLDFATLRQVHPQVPTLDETLDALPDPGFVLNIEIKNGPEEPGYDPDRRIGTVIAEWVERRAVKERVIVSSFDRAAIDAVRAAGAGITTGLLTGHRLAVGPHLAGVAADGHEWVLPHHVRFLIAARRTIGAAHDAGLRVGTWTLDSPRRSEHLARAGIDAVITNAPGIIRRRLVSSY
jgi:glycerophosphoryl diester phosphodiesterase